MIAKTATERTRAIRERRAEQGLTRLEVYAHPDDHTAIKAYAAKVQKKRDKAARELEKQHE